MTASKKNYWKPLSIALLAVFTVSLAIPRAGAATDISQLTQQILGIVKSTVFGNQAIKNAINALQTSLNALQTSVDSIDTTDLDATISSRATQASVDALQSHAITVKAIEPGDDIVLLPLEEGIMYKGHVSGIMSVSAVDDNRIGLFCALHGNNAPTLGVADLNNFDGPAEFQSVAIDANFTCTSLTLEAFPVTEGTIANLAIDYSVIEGIEEFETSP